MRIEINLVCQGRVFIAVDGAVYCGNCFSPTPLYRDVINHSDLVNLSEAELWIREWWENASFKYSKYYTTRVPHDHLSPEEIFLAITP